MMSTKDFARLAGLLIAGAFAATNAHAFIINFDDQGLTGPSTADAATAATLTINGTTFGAPATFGNVVFAGGAILTNATAAPADETSVYYTSFFCCGTGTTPNTLTITFPQNINNFFVDLYNGQSFADTFTASDNSGMSTTVTIPPNTSSGNALISFPALGDQVTITTTDPSYDFFIDNIGFDQPTPAVPAPLIGHGLPVLLAVGMTLFGASLLGRARRRRLSGNAVPHAVA
jgi:hypothetical protein